MKINKKGFTLLELLVVVIIIGVLAAIALPLYRKAVAKAELAQLLNIEKAISNAEQRYFLTHDAYADTLQELDIEYNLANGINCQIGEAKYVRCYNKNFFITHYFIQTTTLKNLRECYSRNKTLAFACEELFKGEASLSNNGHCYHIGGAPCYEVRTHMPI